MAPTSRPTRLTQHQRNHQRNKINDAFANAFASMGSNGLQHEKPAPTITEENIVAMPPKDDVAIANETPAAMPNEMTISMDTAAINEHIEGASFEAMDVDEVKATNGEEKHGKCDHDIMMNVVAQSSKKWICSKSCGTFDVAVWWCCTKESFGALVCWKPWKIDFRPEELSLKRDFIEHEFSRLQNFLNILPTGNGQNLTHI